MEKSKKPNRNKVKWWSDLTAIFLISFLSLTALVWGYSKIYENKIYPGVKVGSLSLGGKTIPQTRQLLQERVDQIYREGLRFIYENKEVDITPEIISPEDPDFFYQIVSFDLEKMLKEAYQVGRSDHWFTAFISPIETLVLGETLPALFKINEDEIIDILADNFSFVEIPAKDAELEISTNDLEVTPEQLGRSFNFEAALELVKTKLNFLESSSVELFLETDYPEIYQKDTAEARGEAQVIWGLAPLKFKYQDKEWPVAKEQLGEWLKFEKIKGEADNLVGIGFKKDKVEEFFKKISEEINIPAQNARFEIIAGKVKEFQTSQDGLALAVEENFLKFKELVLEKKEKEIELLTKEIKANIITEQINSFGIKELIGVGKSNFAGSPKNRRHNIKIGAEALNGLLIQPGEEFSLGRALGEIDSEAGYLLEMVIKGNKTIPEYGGGLCQIATTIFRAAMGAGLPITERHSHAYRVMYYEPAGVDAAIYTPGVDVKFINDTGNYILIQTRISGDDLTFEFYGTRDGRKIEQTTPKIYNLVSPPPAKIIETPDLPVGEKKCTERAHTGADTEFTYRVTYPSGEVKEKIFYSHYRPWQEVCLVGVEIKKEAVPETATSSNSENQEEKKEELNEEIKIEETSTNINED